MPKNESEPFTMFLSTDLNNTNFIGKNKIINRLNSYCFHCNFKKNIAEGINDS